MSDGKSDVACQLVCFPVCVCLSPVPLSSVFSRWNNRQLVLDLKRRGRRTNCVSETTHSQTHTPIRFGLPREPHFRGLARVALLLASQRLHKKTRALSGKLSMHAREKNVCLSGVGVLQSQSRARRCVEASQPIVENRRTMRRYSICTLFRFHRHCCSCGVGALGCALTPGNIHRNCLSENQTEHTAGT